MTRQGVVGFPYYVGIDSPAQLATPHATTCVPHPLATAPRTGTPSTPPPPGA